MPNPEVSIIVPVYNVEKYLERCVSSLLNQTLKDIEIILVDDSSKDSSYEICKKLADADSRIKVIHKENQGAGMARNAALNIASGKYVGFVDSDDFVEPDMFETLCKKAETYNSDLVLSGVLFVDGNMFSQKGDCIRKPYFDKDTQFETKDEISKLRIGIVGSLPEDAEDSKYGMSIWKNLFKLEIIKKNNLVFQSEREIYSEDALFMVDYIACIQKATGIPECFYNYCRNEDSISKSYKKDRFEKSLAFLNQVEQKFEKSLTKDIYSIYTHRFWQAMCRVLCSQEIMYAEDNNIKYSELKKRLEMICTHPLTTEALKNYPIFKLPLKQGVFAFGVKHRLYLLLKLLVKFRR